MTELHTSWFSSGQFLPHGHCYMWSPGVLWMNVVADILIAMAYFTIPFALLYIARRRRDLPFDWLVVCFGIFIVACGLTHVMDVWNVWHTHYWLEGIIKLLTAAASVPTAILLWRFLPGILQLPSQRQLRDANESLARANRELEAFTASVSHDLRSPLTTIAGQAGLLELSLPDATDEQKRRLTRIQGSVRQMSELIEALLVLSRISRQTLHREIVDVTALAESIVQDMRQKDPARSVEVAIQPNMTVHGDRRLVGDLFQNLIGNAWKFTSKTGQRAHRDRPVERRLAGDAVHPRQRRGLRHGVRAEAVQAVPAPARRGGLRRLGRRPRDRRAHRRSPRRPHLGRGQAERRRGVLFHAADRADHRRVHGPASRAGVSKPVSS